jgi:hypothetical protein
MMAAANQQATQQRLAAQAQAAQDQRDQTARYRALQAGWEPVQAETRMPGGMIDRTKPLNPNADPKRQKMMIGGQLMSKPTEVESGKAYIPKEGSLMYNLHMAQGWDGKSPVTASESHSLAMAVNEAESQLNEPVEIDATGRFRDADGNPAAVAIGKRTHTVQPLRNMRGGAAQPASGAGLPGGAFDGAAAQPNAAPAQPASAFPFTPPDQAAAQTATPAVPTVPTRPTLKRREPGDAQGAGLPGGAFDGTAAPAPAGGPFSFALPEKAAKEPRKETADDWVRIITDPESDPAEKTRATNALALWRAPGTESDKDRDLTRAAIAGDRAERRSERDQTRAEAQKKIFRGFEATKKKSIDTANKEYRKALAVAFTPEDKKAAADQLRSDVDDAQKEYEIAIGGETGQDVPHNNWAAGIQPEPDAKDPAGLRKKKADPLGIR